MHLIWKTENFLIRNCSSLWLELIHLSYTKELCSFLSETCNAVVSVCCCLPLDNDQKVLTFPYLAQTVDHTGSCETRRGKQNLGTMGGYSLARLTVPHRVRIMWP